MNTVCKHCNRLHACRRARPSWSKPPVARASTSAHAAKADGVSGLRAALSGSVNPAFQEGAAFLRELGMDNPAEIARVLDIAMNPQSLFATFRDKKRATNDSARTLSVVQDMQPVIEFLRWQGLESRQLVTVITEHPPVLSYSVSDRLQPFFEYLQSVGIKEPAEVVAARPSILGLDVELNLRRIVEYLVAHGHSEEDIATYLAKSL